MCTNHCYSLMCKSPLIFNVIFPVPYIPMLCSNTGISMWAKLEKLIYVSFYQLASVHRLSEISCGLEDTAVCAGMTIWVASFK